jgi:endonuclease-3
VAFEGGVVDGEPCLVVSSGLEGPGGHRTGARYPLGWEGERDAHLEEVAFGMEAESGGFGVILVGGLHEPEADIGRGGGVVQGGAEELCLDRLWVVVSGVAALVGPVVPSMRRVDRHVQCRRPVESGHDQGAADERVTLVAEHGLRTVVSEVPPRRGNALGFGESGMAVGFLAALQEDGDVGELHIVEFRQDQHVHARTLTRYRVGVGRPRTSKGMARVVIQRLAEEYPGTADDLCALDHDSAFQLLVATILSAQSTDVRVNMVTPAVFASYPDPAALALSNPDELEVLIHSTGFFRAKARSLIGMAAGVEDRFGGEVPTALEDLVTLPGVGRKTANVVRSVAFGLPGLPVDTHVLRLSKRLGLTTLTDPVKVELELNALVPAAERGAFSLRLILHGRAVCVARKPACIRCILADICPSSTV